MTARRRWVGVDFPTGGSDGLRIDARTGEQADYYERLARTAVEERMQKITVWPDAMKEDECRKVFVALEQAYPRVYKHEPRPASLEQMHAGLAADNAGLAADHDGLTTDTVH